MVKVGNFIKYLQMTSAGVEVRVHWGGNSAALSWVTLEMINLAAPAMALQ